MRTIGLEIGGWWCLSVCAGSQAIVPVHSFGHTRTTTFDHTDGSAQANSGPLFRNYQ